jgi:hypothetical protein
VNVTTMISAAPTLSAALTAAPATQSSLNSVVTGPPEGMRGRRAMLAL